MPLVLAAYVPVLHEGYARLFSTHGTVDAIILIPREIARAISPDTDYIRKDLRALGPESVASALHAWMPEQRIVTATEEVLRGLNNAETRTILPDEDVSHAAAARYFPLARTTYDEIFLRWDRARATIDISIHPDRVIPFEGVAAALLRVAEKESRKSTDWWRHIGAVIALDGSLLLTAYNRSLFSPHLVYAEGDVRSLFSRGVRIDLMTAIHAEADLIATAACNGIALQGAELYTTTFPCPPCAKLIARSGIVRCFYADGYAMLDGERVLRDANVELVLVQKEGPRC
ncbi:MAG: deaminase [bacterium]